MKTSCDVIRDLLPLYADHVTSDASSALVEEHLNECPDCRKELEQMQRPVPVKLEEVPAATLKKIKRDIHKKIICTVLAAVAIVICLGAVSMKLYNAQTIVTLEEAKIWVYNTKKDGANLCNLKVQGEGVYLRYKDENFDWIEHLNYGETVVELQAVKDTYPKFHALLEPLVKRFFVQDMDDLLRQGKRTVIGVGNTQVLSLECADDTVYYQKGQQVYRYAIEGRDGNIKYVYGTPDSIVGRRYGGE